MHRRAARTAVAVLAAALTATALALPASAAPTWGPISTLTTAGDNTTGRLAVNSRGTTIAYWETFDGQVQSTRTARRLSGGAWSGPVTVPGSTVSWVEDAQIMLDDNDRAVAIFSRAMEGGASVRAVHQSATGTWGAPVPVSSPGSEIAGDADAAMDGQGNVIVVWAATDDSGTHVFAARRPAGGSWSSPVAISADSAAQPQVAFDGAGNATAMWEREEDGVIEVQQAVRPAGGSWSEPETITESSDGELDLTLAMNDDGDAVAGFAHPGWAIEGSTEAMYRPAGGDWEDPVTLSAAGQASGGPRVALDAQGNAVAAWTQLENGSSRAPVSERTAAGPWSAAVPLAGPGVEGFPGNVSFAPDGTAMVSLRSSSGDLMRVVQRPPGGSWAAPVPVSDADRQSGGIFATHDNQGNAIAIWNLNDATGNGIQTRTLDAAGPTAAMTQPTSTRATSTSFGAAWSASDRWSAVASKDVRYRQAPWNGGFGGHTAWHSATTANSATFAGVAGRTYCISARARDEHGNEGGWSSERCTATPLDDRMLTRTSAWTRGTSSSYYLGTFTSTKTYGAYLTRTGVQAKHLALLVTKCASCGKVKVSLNGTTLGTFDLHSSTTKRKQIVGVKTFSAVQTGTLKIQSVSPTGKAVYVDGVIARRS